MAKQYRKKGHRASAIGQKETTTMKKSTSDGRESDVASQREQKLQDENQALRDQIELMENEQKIRDHTLRKYIETLEVRISERCSTCGHSEKDCT